jgi:hypothetical protein
MMRFKVKIAYIKELLKKLKYQIASYPKAVKVYASPLISNIETDQKLQLQLF